jgi:hypothetical protein
MFLKVETNEMRQPRNGGRYLPLFWGGFEQLGRALRSYFPISSKPPQKKGQLSAMWHYN